MRVLRSSFAFGLVVAALPAAGVAAPKTVTFLHVNDVYEIAPGDEGGGFAPLMTLLEEERARHPNTITTFGGDLLSPSILSGLTQGAQMIAMLNAIGTDVAVPGNHEFDFGPKVASERFTESKFPWIAANVMDEATNAPLSGTVSGHLMPLGDDEIGFLGVVTPETATLSSPGPTVRFADPIEAAAKAAADLKAAGADLVVALTHENFADDRRLLDAVDDVDIVLGGHDHNPITWYDDGGLILKAGHDAHYLAVLDVTLDRALDDGEVKTVWRPTWRYLATKGVAPDPTVAALVDGYEKRLDTELGVPVGEAAVTLDTRRGTVRGEESNFGNFVADALKSATGADVALTNGGGIRGDRTYPAGTVLTRKDILSELPFGNLAVLIELSGIDLKAALENGVSQVEDGGGRFPQVAGMAFAYRGDAPPGERIAEVTVGGEPLDPSKTYKVATNDYVYGGGDGYAALTAGRALIDASGGKLMANTVMNYATAKGGRIAPGVEGRITRLD